MTQAKRLFLSSLCFFLILNQIIMKIILFLLIILFSCKTADQRIQENHYTDEWYYLNGTRYQVYKCNNKVKYIIILNKKNNKLIRQQIKT